MTTSQPGDLVFFAGNPHNPVDLAIMLKTGGNLTHVECVYRVAPTGQVLTIGALSSGVTLHPLPALGIPAATAAHTSPARLPGALAWLRGQVGQPYSWNDIADQALTLLDPDAPVVSDGHYDCSHLAAVFLTHAGYPLPPALLARPELISPVSLARAVGLSVASAPQLLPPFLARVFPTGR